MYKLIILTILTLNFASSAQAITACNLLNSGASAFNQATMTTKNTLESLENRLSTYIDDTYSYDNTQLVENAIYGSLYSKLLEDCNSGSKKNVSCVPLQKAHSAHLHNIKVFLDDANSSQKDSDNALIAIYKWYAPNVNAILRHVGCQEIY
jgi:hypothetical protein